MFNVTFMNLETGKGRDVKLPIMPELGEKVLWGDNEKFQVIISRHYEINEKGIFIVFNCNYFI